MRILHLLSGGGIGGIEMLCFNIAKLSQNQDEFCFLFGGGSIADKMQKEEVPVYLYYKKNIVSRIWQLFKLAKGKKYDIVIVHHEGMGIYFFYLMLMHFFKNAKFIKYLHCSFEEKYFYENNVLKDWLNYRFLREALLKSDCAIAVSEFVKKSYCNEFNYDEDKIKVVYNGIELINNNKNFCKREKNTKIKLLYIGRLVEVKGIRHLLYAVQKLIKIEGEIHLEILGDGSERNVYEQLVKELQIEDYVCFYGYQLRKQTFYDDAQIFVYPSVWQEAFGISIVEALAQGMICVASDIGGIPEIITDATDGFLFESSNVESLTETLVKAINLYKCEIKREEMIRAAKERAKAFDIDKTINDLQKIFNNFNVL